MLALRLCSNSASMKLPQTLAGLCKSLPHINVLNIRAASNGSFRTSRLGLRRFSSAIIIPQPTPKSGLWRRGYTSILPTLPKLTRLEPRFFSSNTPNTQFHDAYPDNAPLPVLSPPSVGYWLIGSSVLVFAVIVVGGLTRLTESGLSITEWRPITGILPPLSDREWEEEFGKYKGTPEFKL
jgi:cytochrome c oxidase assembly protein subunit 15